MQNETEFPSFSAGAQPAARVAPRDAQLPLVVDLDGTLLRSDLLLETLFDVLGRLPLVSLRLPGWLLKGKAAFKRDIAKRANIDPVGLPYNKDVLEHFPIIPDRSRN